MRLLRTIWGMRLLTSLLLVSLLPVYTVSPASAADMVVLSSHADWLRAQVRGSTSEAFESALEAAAASNARSKQAFLEAFVKAFEAQQPDESLSVYFTEQPLSNEQLVLLLQGRSLGLLSDGMFVVRHYLSVASQTSSRMMDRHGGMGSAVLLPTAVSAGSQAIYSRAPQPFVVSFRTLSSAQPLGP